MPKIKYINATFRSTTMAKIQIANNIIRAYQAQGFTLTLRQLYYQMVARDYIPNNQKEYDKLGATISKARKAGLIDWHAIEDRTRSPRSLQHWTDPAEIVKAAVNSFRLDLWASQRRRIEVWIEKDALAGVIAPICAELDITYFSCRGYASDSEMWRAGRRLKQYIRAGQKPLILHLGDLDPSGIDMTRDIKERLLMYAERPISVKRIALNMDQIEQYGPPPNPAKTTDSRYQSYIDEYGFESWELDALEPAVLSALIEKEVLALRDEQAWTKALKKQGEGTAVLEKAEQTIKASWA